MRLSHEAPSVEDGAPSCPFAHGQAGLSPNEPLHVPHPKRLRWTYDTTDTGGRRLRINYGIKEITFDEERFFAFGQRLGQEGPFTGAEAMTWGPGLPWAELRTMIEGLLEHQILQRGTHTIDPRGTGLVPSLAAPARCPAPRTWTADDCEALSRELSGRAVEIGYLEAFVPVHRIAHSAVDADDRQVGEANAYPEPLRVARETEWRVCQYPGSRYRDVTPMNITALRAMIKYWKPMLGVLCAVRGELQQRLRLPDSGWKIGEIHVFGAVVCGLPAFELLRASSGGARLPLHPVLSSMFRVTDGVRMSMHEMLFDVEAHRSPEQRLTAAELHAHVERNASLLASHYGVCAGPPHMIDEYLSVVLDAIGMDRYAAAEQAEPVRALLAELPRAVDYGLFGMQTWSLMMWTWGQQGQAYQDLIELLAVAAPQSAVLERVRADWPAVQNMQFALPYDREVHRIAYADAYARCWRALRTPVGPPSHAEATAPRPTGPEHEAARASLLLRLGQLVGAQGAAAIADRIVSYLQHEQALLASVTAIQKALDELLGRPAPTRPLTSRDFRVGFMLEDHSYPNLIETLEEALAIELHCTASELAVRPRALA